MERKNIKPTLDKIYTMSLFNRIWNLFRKISMVVPQAPNPVKAIPIAKKVKFPRPSILRILIREIS